MTRTVSVVALACGALFAWVAAADAPPKGDARPPMPAARKIPGLTADDAFPQACVGCHLNYADKKLDTRFATLIGKWKDAVEPKVLAAAQAASAEGVTLKGKHPEKPIAFKDIPNECIKCHRAMKKKAPDFAKMVHLIHLKGGADNHFLSMFQGECTHCHKLDLDKGTWTVPSGPEK